jgi:hypothetical protein
VSAVCVAFHALRPLPTNRSASTPSPRGSPRRSERGEWSPRTTTPGAKRALLLL